MAITITGSNDAPTISSGSGEVTEDIDVTAQGQLTIGGDLNLVPGSDDETTTLTFTPDGDNYLGTLTLNPDGSWQFSVDNNLAAIQALEPGESIVQTYTVTVDDGQGGVSTDTITITILGTGEIRDGESTTIILDDADTAGNSVDTHSARMLFTAGALALSGFAFGDTTSIQVNGLDGEISWSLDGDGNLIGTIDGNAVLLLSLSDTSIEAGQSGSVIVTVTLLDNLQHNIDVDALSIEGILIEGQDAHANIASGTLDLIVQDDGVELVVGDHNGTNEIGYQGVGALDIDGVDQAFSADLSGNIDGWNGSDVTFADSGLSTNGYTIFYYVDPANPDVLIAYMDTNETPSAYSGADGQQHVFTLTLDAQTGSYSIEVSQTIDKLETISVAGLIGGAGGNNEEVYVGYDANTGAFDVDNNLDALAANFSLAFTLSARSADGSKGSVNGNTNGFGVDNAFIDSGEFLILDYATDVVSASITFSGADTITYYAYDAAGNLLGTGTMVSGDTISNLGSISYIELTPTGDAKGLNFQFDGTSARTLISTTEDVTLDLVADVIDSDGDSTRDDFTVNLDAPDQQLIGAEQDDTLAGQGGDDLLRGGLGADILTGGNGADTFQWLSGDADGSTDRITDFNPDDGDQLDLSDLLQGANVANLDQYLSLSLEDGNTVIQIDTNGGADGGDSLTIVLEDAQYDSVDALMNEGALIIAPPTPASAVGNGSSEPLDHHIQDQLIP
ncbi:type I secretion C-terminal target domain-containing protein [Ferrimonas gelatinilytica]|uniref:RapA2 cadherin-like domain-containing protein n=1 Tax=Ferrimonas gelatinilytica TaxID=1255257 RepID=A0ABP9RUI3_9GAMM